MLHNSFAGNILAIKKFLLSFKRQGGGEGRREGRRGGRGPIVVHLPCARSPSNASLLAAVLVDRFFHWCLVARREERRTRGREKREKRGKKREGRKRERAIKEKEGNSEKKENKNTDHTTQHTTTKHQHQHQHNTPRNTPRNTPHNTPPSCTQNTHSTADNRPRSCQCHL